jgi:hypothetical protein
MIKSLGFTVFVTLRRLEIPPPGGKKTGRGSDRHQGGLSQIKPRTICAISPFALIREIGVSFCVFPRVRGLIIERLSFVASFAWCKTSAFVQLCVLASWREIDLLLLGADFTRSITQ